MRALFVPVQGSVAFEVTSQLVLVGRDVRCDVKLQEPSVSRQHCVLGLCGQGVLLRDLNSSNGCWVNGHQRTHAILQQDDLLGVGSVRYRLCLTSDDTESLTDASDTEKAAPQTTSRGFSADDHQRLFVGEWNSGLQVFEGCRLIDRLGAGGFGEVWKARRDGFGEIAVKRIPLADVHRSERRAVKAMRGARHRNVARIFGCRRRADVLVVAMELGELTLEDLLARYQRLGYTGIPRPELLRYLRHAASGLDYLYTEFRLLHRDVKPANVLLVRNVAKLSDFGLVKPLDAGDGLHSGVGSLEYAPPEFFDEKMAPSSDQYSLAVMYLYLATGRFPFPGPDLRQMMMQKYYKDPELTGIASEEHPILRRALSRDPEKRFPSCIAFVRALMSAKSAPFQPYKQAVQIA